MADPALQTKIKVQLKLSIARLRMVQQRDEAMSKQARRQMAQLLEQGKIESARIRVENIIRSDITTELHEILELYCELLLARAGLMEAAAVDPGLEEAIRSLLYAAPKTEIKELQQTRLLFAEKYGKEFVLGATDNVDGKVSENVVRKLSVVPPKPELVQGYLEEIAKTYGVDWPRRAKEDLGEAPNFLEDENDNPPLATTDDDDDDATGGDEGGGGGGGGLGQKAFEPLIPAETTPLKAKAAPAPPKSEVGAQSPVQVYPPSPSTDNLRPKVTLNQQELKPATAASTATSKTSSSAAAAAKKKAAADSKGTDYDELAKRFAALKR